LSKKKLEFEILTHKRYRDLGFWAKSEPILNSNYDNEGYLVLRGRRIFIGYIAPIGKDKISFSLYTRKQKKSFKYKISGYIHFFKATMNFTSHTKGELICEGCKDYINEIKDMLEVIITSYYKNFQHGGRP